jgi:hypothetical protein
VRSDAVPSARASLAPRAIQITGATIGFLIAYATITVLHAVGHEPAVIRALSPIPLFARIVSSAIAAVPSGLLLPRVLPARTVRAMPALLAMGIALVSVAILVFA